MMSVNLLLFFCLTFNYHATIKKRLICAFMAYMVLLCIEASVVMLTNSFAPSLLESSPYDSIEGLILIKLVSLFVISMISNLKNVRKDIPMPNFYWFSMIFVSGASLYLLIEFFYGLRPDDQIKAAIITLTILTINFIVLFVYDNLYRAFTLHSEKLLLEQQNNAYEKQMEIMRKSSKATQIIRHDIKNHMLTLKQLCAACRSEDAEKYIDEILTNVDQRREFTDSGNTAIDSIVNFYAQKATDMGIIPDIDITIPQNLAMPNYEITTILGNLLDNAITALERCEGNRTFSISINYNKGNIIFTITNSHDGKLNEKNGLLLTVKNESGHGLGLVSVNESLEKIDGHLEVWYDSKLFRVTALFPHY